MASQSPYVTIIDSLLSNALAYSSYLGLESESAIGTELGKEKWFPQPLHILPSKSSSPCYAI